MYRPSFRWLVRAEHLRDQYEVGHLRESDTRIDDERTTESQTQTEVSDFKVEVRHT